MSCLIYASNGEQCIGKCDANCYNATHQDCDCVCGGKNHGVGYKKAVENTIKYADEWIEKYAKHKGLKQNDVKVNQEIFQLSLF